MEMTEQETQLALELQRLRRYIVTECSKIIERAFESERITNATRNQDEQNLLGNNNTVIESIIKNELKGLI